MSEFGAWDLNVLYWAYMYAFHENGMMMMVVDGILNVIATTCRIRYYLSRDSLSLIRWVIAYAVEKHG